MSIYLHDIPLPEALARLEAELKSAGRWGVLGKEKIPLDEHALGRVLCEPVWAKISSPHYHAAAMDGFAVRAIDTIDAMPNHPVELALQDKSARASAGAQAVYVDTGDPLPEWCDAVIPIENVEPIQQDGSPEKELRYPYAIRIRASVTPWAHVRPMGEDIVATQLVLPKGHTLRPYDLGAIAACGHTTIVVARRPRVAVIPTGSELIPIGQPVKVGDIIEYNSLVLASQVQAWGGAATRYPIIPDDFNLILETVAEAARQHDLILLNAGSSAGSEDYSARVVEALGRVLVHGIAVRPGHPVILGMVGVHDGQNGDCVPIIGVPGYPVSAALTGEIIVEPLLARWRGCLPNEPVKIKARMTRKVISPPGDDDYLRVAVGRVGDDLLAAPLARGSGVITSLVRADGIALIPRGSQGVPAGAEVEVSLFRHPFELERTIFAIGSHDISLDLMAHFLAERSRRLASANVGSLGGLVALQRGEAHLAGSHLLDPETGEYNLSYVKEYLPGVAVKVITLVGRQQGLLVTHGNPKQITSLSDLARPNISFVNRQRGAGTRVLLDYQLDKLGISPIDIKGYLQEEYTHLAVAAAVASGRADCGLGIAAAAYALDLDFLPLFQEPYQLVIPTQYYNSELLFPFMELLHDPDFQRSVAALPGYDVSQMGIVNAELC